MNGAKKDIDPTTELVEEDEEQTLPELEQDTAIDLRSMPATAAALVRLPPAARRSRAMPSSRRPRPASTA